jgi:hypothetical protein
LRAFSFGELGDLVQVDLMHVPLYSLAGKTVSTVAYQHVDVAEEDRIGGITPMVIEETKDAPWCVASPF